MLRALVSRDAKVKAWLYLQADNRSKARMSHLYRKQNRRTV